MQTNHGIAFSSGIGIYPDNIDFDYEFCGNHVIHQQEAEYADEFIVMYRNIEGSEINNISELFETSTMVKPKVIAPLINYTKGDIVRIAVEGFMPLELVRSCYNSSDKHCGKCESCDHLKRALLANNCERYISYLIY